MPQFDGPIIDIDLHHRWHDERELVAHLPARWRDVVDRDRSSLPLESAVTSYPHVTGTNKRVDAAPPSGGPAGSHYETLREQWLDAYPVERAVLTFDIGMVGGVPNPYLASALCRAANDWNAERWLGPGGDERLFGGALVPTQIPSDGVDELRRMADNPRIVEALVVANGLGKPFGHPMYHELFAAAEECGLPIAIHNGGDQPNVGSHSTAAGLPVTRFEFHTLLTQAVQGHLSSLIMHGVFERFPGLKVLFVEAGFSWLPPLLWSLDRHYPELREESPWVKRLPSEYVREHVRFSTQPIDITTTGRQMQTLLEAFDGFEDVLLFASDYPHWDTDDPVYLAGRLPQSWWPKVFHDNARDLLRWPVAAPAGGAR